MRPSLTTRGAVVLLAALAGCGGSRPTGRSPNEGSSLDSTLTPDQPIVDAPRVADLAREAPHDARPPDRAVPDSAPDGGRPDRAPPEARPDSGPADAPVCLSPCPSGESCIMGVCELVFCTPGAEACVGTSVSTCNATGTGRTAVDCGSGMTCVSSASGSATCKPIVCTPGTTCSGSSLVTCDPTGTSSSTIDCSASGGACVPSGSSAPASCQPIVCAPGSTSCAGATLVTCDASGTSQIPTPCATDQTCIASGGSASCQAITCTSGAVYCTSSGILTCSSSGTGSTTMACPAGDTCIIGGSGPTCVPLVCTPGATSCSGSTLVTCNGSGTGTNTVDCKASGGLCTTSSSGAACQTLVCSPGATSCAGSTLVTCNATGTGTTSSDCAAAGEVCLASAGTASCQAIVCTAGGTVCSGSTLLTCNASGTATSSTSCAPSAACVESGGSASCQTIVCTPGASSCSGNTLEVCNSTGTAWGSLACGSSAVCTTSGGSSSCQSLVCTPGAKFCASDGLTVMQCNATGTGSSATGTCDRSIGQSCTGAGACTGSCTLIAAIKGNVGCEFWPVDLWNAGLGQYGVVVANPSTSQSATVTMADNHGNTQTQSITPGGTASFTWISTLDRMYGRDDGASCPDEPAVCPRWCTCYETYSQWNNDAFHVTSSIPVAAYQFNPYNDSGVFSGTAAVLLPEQALTGNYLYLGRAMQIVEGLWPALGSSDLVVVATRNGTTVTVTTPAKIQPSIGGKTVKPVAAIAAGGSATFTLNQYDTLELTEPDTEGADLSGLVVTASLPVAAYSTSGGTTLPGGACTSSATCPAGNSCSAITPSGSVCASLGGDHFETQLYPAETWDTDYFLVKTEPRVVTGTCASDADCANGLSCSGGQCVDADLYRVLAQENGTVVTTSDPAIVIPTLNKGQYYELATARSLLVQASHPVLVHQFVQPWGDFQSSTAVDTTIYSVPPNNGCNESTGWPNVRCIGDANMMPAIPKGQMRSEYVFFTPATYAWDFVDVIAPLGTSLTLDGGAVAALTKIGSTTFGYVRVQLANVGGAHTISGSRPFGIQVYGYDSYVSYGYPGGLDLNPIAVGR